MRAFSENSSSSNCLYEEKCVSTSNAIVKVNTIIYNSDWKERSFIIFNQNDRENNENDIHVYRECKEEKKNKKKWVMKKYIDG